MEPLAGAAPAMFSYKENTQAAAERQEKWWAATVLPRVLRFKRPLHHSLMLAARKMVAIPSAALGRAGLWNRLERWLDCGMKRAALFASRMSNERSADELRPR